MLLKFFLLLLFQIHSAAKKIHFSVSSCPKLLRPNRSLSPSEYCNGGRMAVGTSALSASIDQNSGINPWLVAITVTRSMKI